MNIFEDLTLLVASFTAALFGQGGGVFYTPLQVWSGIDFHTAAPISLFLIFIISLSSTLVFGRAHQVDWGIALAMEAPTSLGAFTGGLLSPYVSSRTLGIILTTLLLIAAWFMFHPPVASARPAQSPSRSRWIWKRTLNGQDYQLDFRLEVH